MATCADCEYKYAHDPVFNRCPACGGIWVKYKSEKPDHKSAISMIDAKMAELLQGIERNKTTIARHEEAIKQANTHYNKLLISKAVLEGSS